MKPVYDVLEKNRGKVIYFDFGLDGVLLVWLKWSL